MKKVLTLLKVLFVGVIIGGALVGVSKLEPRTVHVEVPRQSRTLEQLIDEVSPVYGISPALAAAIVERESNGRKDAIRYEPGQLSRAQKITKDPEQQRMYASSHCALQVMGWHAPRFSLSWSDLYDPETCFEVGMTILKDCMDRHAGKSKVQQIRGALTCYNGSEKYADAVIKRIGESMIERSL